MSSNEKQQHFPPPPPGPPPAHASQAQLPKHSNETPLPDYNIPAYNPAHPQFAPPPTAADNDIYDATPTDEHPPKLPDSSDHHHHGGDGAQRKSHKLAALGSTITSKVSGPVNALAHKFGSEGFMPEPLDKECEKAARILKGFCKDGIYSDTVPQTASTPATTAVSPTTPSTAAAKSADAAKPKKSRVLLTIPSKVIARAQGLAIFTAVRVGFQATGSSGSGILIARLPDGSWSPPSGIQITSIGAGFVAGLDIYDCVIVINTREALDLFTRTRLSLGSDLAVTAGPFGVGGSLDFGVPQSQADSKGKGKGKAEDGRAERPATLAAPLSPDNRQFQTPAPVPEPEAAEGDKRGTNRRPNPFREAISKPVYSYVKSRGFYAGWQIDGTVIAERDGANAKFYGQPVPVAKILRGEVPAQGPPGMWPAGAKSLFDVLKGAEGLHGQQARPVSSGAGASPAAGRAGVPATGVAAVTAGMQGMTVGGSNAAAGPSTAHHDPAPTTSASAAKAAEAAAEAEAARAEEAGPPPPMYSEEHGTEDLPPAYDESTARPAAGDSKTGLH
ncbi:hypothetical protein VTK56DRAFT_1503 [Thermocarpiscus australiensis]